VRDSPIREVYFAPLLLCSVMVGCALIAAQLAGVSSRLLFVPYFSSSLAITFVSLLLTIFWWAFQLARHGADAPLRKIGKNLVERAVYLFLPAAVFPLFLVSFTTVKTAIPFLVGYSWDPFWAQADRLLFGDDGWRIAQHWLGRGSAVWMEWFYSVGWGLALIFVMALVPLNAAPRFTGKFYVAMLATWLVAGVALAYLFSAAGPVFAHVVNSERADPSIDLHRFLNSSLGQNSPIRLSQQYLALALDSHVAVKGGGISAMASVHLGAASIYVLSARRTFWFIPSILFWIVIFVCSAYFGYHYWIDGIVAALVAALCWIVAERMLTPIPETMRSPACVQTVPVG
jgi:hypothetical protein